MIFTRLVDFHFNFLTRHHIWHILLANPAYFFFNRYSAKNLMNLQKIFRPCCILFSGKSGKQWHGDRFYILQNFHRIWRQVSIIWWWWIAKDIAICRHRIFIEEVKCLANMTKCFVTSSPPSPSFGQSLFFCHFSFIQTNEKFRKFLIKDFAHCYFTPLYAQSVTGKLNFTSSTFKKKCCEESSREISSLCALYKHNSLNCGGIKWAKWKFMQCCMKQHSNTYQME